ncbi:MAG TPA: MotA/TolQ/ExbB proton channel family protein [Candidatus Cloacimonadota bacterium]|nr:MotA/TolQ/ExbB proton channel family protein [Candidatus Cloacimonadota bacterium]
MSIFSIFAKGGILMWILLLISISVIAIVIEKYRKISRARGLNSKLINSLQAQDKLENLRSVLRIYEDESPLSAVLSKLYLEHNDDPQLMRESMESCADIEMHKLEKGMVWLSTFAAIAPLVGFLGTVIGMVKVFMNMQAASQSGVDISLLAGGIWEALLTTVGGLVVGIPALIFYNDLVQNLENIAKEIQDHSVAHLIRFQNLINPGNK